MHILMITDGQKHSKDALQFAGMLFKKMSPQVTVLYVQPNGAQETKTEAQQYVDSAESILSVLGITPTLKVVQGDPMQEIIMELQEEDYDLLVIGVKCRADQCASLVMTRVAESLLQKPRAKAASSLHCSLLVVKDPPKVLNHVLLCTDGSPFAESAAHFWGTIPKEYEPRVAVLNIIPPLFSAFSSELKSVTPDLLKVLTKVSSPRTAVLHRTKDILEHYGIEVKTKLREKEYAASEILEEAQEVDYDLIIMGYRGQKYRTKAHAGSQSLEVVKYSHTSVFVYQPKKLVE